MYHEEFLEEPQEVLKRAVEMFGIDPDDEFLKDAAGIVHASPHRSREKVSWSAEVVQCVQSKINDVAFFRDRYTFES